MNRTWKKTVTTILAFALAAGGMMGGASYLNEVSAAEQPVVALREAGEPAEMTVDAGVYEANAGDTIKVKVRACDIKDSFNSVGGRLLVNTEAFSVLSVTPGDTDDPDNENTEIFQKTLTAQSMCSEHTEKIGFIYCELESLKEDTVFLTIELRVNDDAKDGCYTVPFYLRDSSVSMATKIVETEDTWDVFEVNPDYRGALITVGAGSDETIQPEAPEEYNYDYDYDYDNDYNHTNLDEDGVINPIIPEITYSETGQPITTACSDESLTGFTVDAGVYEAKAGDTIKVKIRATDIKQPFCSALGYFIIDEDKFTVLSAEPGDSDDPDDNNNDEGVIVDKDVSLNVFRGAENSKMAVFIYCNLNGNVDEDMVFATVELKVNDDVKDGNYELPFAVLEYGGMACAYNDEMNDIIYDEPEYHGALVKVSSASEETIPEEQPGVSENEETVPEEQPEVTENEETPAPAEELPVIEEPEKPVGPGHHGPAGPAVHKPDHRHDHKHDHKPAPKPDHRNDQKNGYEKAVEKIAEDIANVITDVAKFIFSLF